MDQTNLLNRINEDESRRTAFYNTIFMVLLGICLAALYAVYQMFALFITPVLLGSLFGTVLYPLKRSFSSILNEWLDYLDEEDKPLLIGLIQMPIQFLNKTASAIFNGVYSKQGLCCVGAYVLLKILGYDGTLIAVLSFLGRIYSIADTILDLLTQLWVIPLISLYACAYFAWIFIQDNEELKHKKKFARALSLPVWIIILAFASSYCGVLHVFVFSTSAVVLGLIAAGVIDIKLDNSADDTASVVEGENPVETVDNSENSMLPEIKNLEQAITGDRILRMIFILFVLLWISKHDFMLIIAVVLFLYGFILNVAAKLELWDTLTSLVQSTFFIKEHGAKLANIVVPGFLRQFFYILFTSDRYLIGGLKKQVDLISSIAVMIGLAFGTLFFLFFIAFQLQNEFIHIGTLVSNIVSSNPEWLKTAMNYTGDKFNEDAINNYAAQAYRQSREWIGVNVRQLADSQDQRRADQLEEQAKMFVDHVYKLYEERATFPENSTAIANRGDWLAQLLSTTNVDSLKAEFTQIIKDNIETILSIVRSLWKVLSVNISILSTIAFSIFGFLLGFGFDLLNFFIEILVFLMVAYYLLANSSEQFLPLKWISDIAPSIQAKNSDIQIASAIEGAISSVYVLTVKMSIYYFLHTYFVHSLFGLNIVFVPALVAAILAPVPIFPPYSVCVFGIVELYLVRDETLATVVFIIASVSPIFFADAAFYAEIKHCHPYLIGLSIVGGIYSMGIQGAVLGPIILCSLIVLVNVYAEFAKNR